MAAPLIRVIFLLFFSLNARFGHAVRIEDIPRYRFVKNTVCKALQLNKSSYICPFSRFLSSIHLLCDKYELLQNKKKKKKTKKKKKKKKKKKF